MKAFATAVADARARTGELGENWPKAATEILHGRASGAGIVLLVFAQKYIAAGALGGAIK